MGFNTTVLILNDFISEIQANPEQFVKELRNAINSGKETVILGQTTVTRTHHADDHMVYLVGGNSITNVSVPPSYTDKRADINFFLKYCKIAKSLVKALIKSQNNLLWTDLGIKEIRREIRKDALNAPKSSS